MALVALIIAIVSAFAAVGSVFYARKQSSAADRSAKAAEDSADAAKESATVSGTLMRIESDRYWRERKPQWSEVVERAGVNRGLRFRLHLASGDVDRVEVTLPRYAAFSFCSEQPALDGREVLSPRHAVFGPVAESDSAYWRIDWPDRMHGVSQPGIRITSFLGEQVWRDDVKLDQPLIPGSAFEEASGIATGGDVDGARD